MSGRRAVWLVARDLWVVAAAERALRAAGFRVRRAAPGPDGVAPVGGEPSAAGGAEPVPAEREAPAAVVVDLDARGFDPLAAGAAARRRWPGVPLVGLVQHAHGDAIARARAAGWDRIVPRSRLARLGTLLGGRDAATETAP